MSDHIQPCRHRFAYFVPQYYHSPLEYLQSTHRSKPKKNFPARSRINNLVKTQTHTSRVKSSQFTGGDPSWQKKGQLENVSLRTRTTSSSSSHSFYSFELTVVTNVRPNSMIVATHILSASSPHQHIPSRLWVWGWEGVVLLAVLTPGESPRTPMLAHYQPALY